MFRRILCAAAIFIVMSSCVIYRQKTITVSDAVKVQKYFFSRQDTEYLSDEMGNCLMELRSDGPYKSQSYNNKDEGTWHQLKDGRIRFASETHYNNIYTDEFSLGIAGICGKEVLEQLPSIRKRLAGLLDGNNREPFSIYVIEDATKCTCDDNEITTVSAFTYQQEFPRADVADFITAIDAYLKDDEKNVSYLHAYQYPQYGFFMDDFSSYEVPWHLVENLENNLFANPTYLLGFLLFFLISFSSFFLNLFRVSFSIRLILISFFIIFSGSFALGICLG